MKVFLSPSDQWSNTVATGKHSEAKHCIEIAKACEKYLKLNGIDVKIGDSSREETYPTRVKESNAWRADLHIPIHTNAGGGKGTQIFTHPLSLNDKFVKSIYNEVAKITPTPDRGITATTNLYEINETIAVCCYIEVEFHDNISTENWIDTNIDDIGKAIARGVITALGKPFKTNSNTTTNTNTKIYRVQVGAYKIRDNAVKMKMALAKSGYTSFITKVDNLYKVQVGAYKVRKNAENIVKELKKLGYTSFIR